MEQGNLNSIAAVRGHAICVVALCYCCEACLACKCSVRDCERVHTAAIAAANPAADDAVTLSLRALAESPH